MNCDFSDVKVGDKVVVNQTYVRSVRPVKKVSKLHFIVDMGNYELKFRKDGGSRAGSHDSWDVCYATVPTEEVIDEIGLENRRRVCLSYVERYDFTQLPIDKLEEVIKIIKK